MTIRALPLRSLQPILRIPLPQTCLRSAVPACLATEYKPTTIPTSPRRFHASSTRRAADFDPRGIERQSEDVDVCIVGGGPAGLSAAIRLKQLAEKENREIRVLLLEKGSEMGSAPPNKDMELMVTGAHILSGAVIQTNALEELFPNWLENPPEPVTPAKKDRMRYLTKGSSIPIPAPPQMHNKGNYILSLNNLTKWLAEKAEELGVEVYPGFAASEVLYNRDGAVKGVATNDMGISKSGKPKDTYERGMAFHARITMFAEGAHGSLTKTLVKKYNLRKKCDPQTYGIGLKEVWEVPKENWREGEITHSMGYPLDKDTYGGGFMYHFGENLVSLGLVIGLDYKNPYLNPYQEFQRMKHHPLYSSVLKGGTCLSYGARALNEGGYQSIPKVVFPGGALIGCTAGFLNVPKIKGTHTAMKSGILAADAAFQALESASREPIQLYDYEEKLKESWIYKELWQVRNMRPSFHTPLGIYGGIMYCGLEAYVLRGYGPWTLHHKSTDAAATEPAAKYKPITYPKPDGEISFDLLTSVSRTGTNHEEDQPSHLKVADYDKHTKESYPKYQGIENKFCPAGVYEYVDDDTKELGKRFQINAQNCIHCKTCDIKVPTQDITWTVPEGGGGPKYSLT